MIPVVANDLPQARRETRVDLFGLGRQANDTRKKHLGNVGFFARSRQLQAGGHWLGPRDAADAYVDASVLSAPGGHAAARDAGARLIFVPPDVDAVRAAREADLRCVLRLDFHADDGDARAALLARLERLLALDLAIETLLPCPTGEPMGLDTLGFFARLRILAPGLHLAADFARLGHRLAQMAMGFGADQLFGPIVAERSLRVGDNAGNPAMTRKEAALLIGGAGLVPHERLSGERMEAHNP